MSAIKGQVTYELPSCHLDSFQLDRPFLVSRAIQYEQMVKYLNTFSEIGKMIS